MGKLLKTLDWYILKRFLGTYLFSNVLIITIIIIFDISEKIDNFIYATLPEIIFDHYLNFIPYFLNILSNLFTFIAVIFFTSRLAARYETVAILSSGVSYRRFLRPYMIGAALIALTSLYVSHFVIPKANKTRQAFEDKYINNSYQNKETNIHRQVARDQIVYMESFNNTDKSGYKFTLEKKEDGAMIYMLSAESITWDSIRQLWRTGNYYERFIPARKQINKNQLKVGEVNDYKEKLVFGTSKELQLDISPKDFGRVESKVEVMTYPELKAFIAKEREKGSSGIERFEVENYNRTAVPFSTFILTIIGVCLSSRKIRGGLGMHLALGLLLAVSYVMFLRVFSILAINTGFPPFIAVWTPNVLYSGIAFYLYRTAQK